LRAADCAIFFDAPFSPMLPLFRQVTPFLLSRLRLLSFMLIMPIFIDFSPLMPPLPPPIFR